MVFKYFMLWLQLLEWAPKVRESSFPLVPFVQPVPCKQLASKRFRTKQEAGEIDDAEERVLHRSSFDVANLARIIELVQQKGYPYINQI